MLSGSASVERVDYFFFLVTIDSDIVHANSLGTHVIVLNSAKAVRELLEKRSSIYSDRLMFADLSGATLTGQDAVYQACTAFPKPTVRHDAPHLHRY